MITRIVPSRNMFGRGRTPWQLFLLRCDLSSGQQYQTTLSPRKQDWNGPWSGVRAQITFTLFFYFLRGLHIREGFAFTRSLVIELLTNVEMFSLNHLNSWTVITVSRNTNISSKKAFNSDLLLSLIFFDHVMFFKYSIDTMPNSKSKSQQI